MTSDRDIPTSRRISPRALLVAHRGAAHHLAGVAPSLRMQGWSVESETLQSNVPVHVCTRSIARSDVVLHTDSDPSNTHQLRQNADALGVPTAMQMDGVLEYANTFLNPRFKHGLLRPAPADLVLASGAHDQAILESLGNRAVASGLPRLDVFRERLRTTPSKLPPRGLMIATANNAWFTPGMRSRLLGTLHQLKYETQKKRIPVRWRVSAKLADKLGVERDTADLVHSLLQVQGVLTSASTLALEAMIAQRPTGILHPHPWPLWIPSVLNYRGEVRDDVDDDLRRVHDFNGADSDANRAASESNARIMTDTESCWFDHLDQFIDEVLHAEQRVLEIQRRILQSCVQVNAADEMHVPLKLMAEAPEIQSSKPDRQPPILYSEQQEDTVLCHVVQSLAETGSKRVAIAVNTLPTAQLVSIARMQLPQLVGFVFPIETDHQTLLGLPAASTRDFVEQLKPDAVVLTAHEADLSILAAMLWDESANLRLVEDEPSNPKFAHARAVINKAKDAVCFGEVRTTIAKGLCCGLISALPEAVLAGDRPQMILLKGDDQDFKLFQQARLLRESGTQVHSLGWSDHELGACEQYSKLADSFEDHSYAIYGGGLHTTHLLHHALTESRPTFIIDDRDFIDPQLDGIEVIHPDDKRLHKISSIVISSERYESEIWHRCGELRSRGIQVHRLYHDQSVQESGR